MFRFACELLIIFQGTSFKCGSPVTKLHRRRFISCSRLCSGMCLSKRALSPSCRSVSAASCNHYCLTVWSTMSVLIHIAWLVIDLLKRCQSHLFLRQYLASSVYAHLYFGTL